jgi:ABC transporter substrate binding protein
LATADLRPHTTGQSTDERPRLGQPQIEFTIEQTKALNQYFDHTGLMSYGPNFPSLFHRAAEYVDKILRGAKPADIPVEQPTKFDLVINLTTAKALGLTIPESFLLRADEVIE